MYGGGSPPPAPDYSALAKEQGAANVEAAKQTAYLSNPNVISPYGKRTVTYNTTYAMPEPVKPTAPVGLTREQAAAKLNEQGIIAGQKNYNPRTGRYDYGAYEERLSDLMATPDMSEANKQYEEDLAAYKASALTTPTVTEELTPEAQAALTAQQNTQKALAELGLSAVGTVRDVMGKPFQYTGPGLQMSVGDAGQIGSNLDLEKYGLAQGDLGDYGKVTTDLDISNLAAMPVNAGTTAQQAIMSRLQPQLQQERSQLETQLANQGVTPGSQAYQRAMMDQNKRENDLLSQASLQGINLDMAARQQGLSEAGLLGNFRNAAQQQRYQQALGAGGFRNAALSQNQQTALAQMQANNAAQNQRYNQMLQSAQFANTAAGQELQKQLGLYNLPLNTISALMSGSQIQAPQFQGYQGAGVTASPIFQAGQANYQAGLDAYNADVAAGNANMQGIVGLASAAATAY